MNLVELIRELHSENMISYGEAHALEACVEVAKAKWTTEETKKYGELVCIRLAVCQEEIHSNG